MAGKGLPDKKKIKGFIWVIGVFLITVFFASIIGAVNKRKQDTQESQVSKETKSLATEKERLDDIDAEIERQLKSVKKQRDEAEELKIKQQQEKERLEKQKEREIDARVNARLRERSDNGKADQIHVPSMSGGQSSGDYSAGKNMGERQALTQEEQMEDRLNKARESSMFGGMGSSVSSAMSSITGASSDSKDTDSLKSEIDALKKSQDSDRKRYDNYVQMAMKGEMGSGGLPGPVDSNEVWQKNQQSQYEKDQQPIYVKPARQGPVLYEGESVPCVTLAKINTNQPGTLRCMVTSDVYDSLRGDIKVISSGSTINLKYNAAGVSMGQTRVGVIATRLIRTDGSYVNLGGMTGTDEKGQSGLEDEVDTHFWRLLASSMLIAELTVAVQNQSNGNNGVILGQNGQLTSQNAAAQVLLETAKSSMKPYEMSRPTIVIKEGFAMNIIVNKDIVF
jgi:type IV secretory pathway VirB10-like protein